MAIELPRKFRVRRGGDDQPLIDTDIDANTVLGLNLNPNASLTLTSTLSIDDVSGDTTPRTLTVNFNRPITTFDVSKIQVTNAAIGTPVQVSPQQWTIPITPSALGDVTITDIDALGNDGTDDSVASGATQTFTFDTDAPMGVLSGVPAFTNAPFTATLTFSEAVRDVTAAAFGVTNATVSLSSGVDGDTVFTALITPTAVGNVTVESAAGSVNDMNGLPSVAVAAQTSDYNNIKPSVLDNLPALFSGTQIATLTFSKAVNGLVAGDVTVAGGTISNFSFVDGSTVATFDVTGTDEATPVVVSVAADAVADVYGNTNDIYTGTDSTWDNTPPSFSATDMPSPVGVSGVSIPLTVSETLTAELLLAQVSVVNGTATLTGSQPNYTLQITPTASGAMSYSIPANAVTDLSGLSNTVFNSNSVTADLDAPSAAFGSGFATGVSPVFFTVTWDEPVTDFDDNSDVLIANGSLTQIAEIAPMDGTTYSVAITPNAQGAVSITIPVNVAQDIAGNANTTGASSPNIVFDTSAPTATDDLVDFSGATTVNVVFDEDVDPLVIGDITGNNAAVSNFSWDAATNTATFQLTGTASPAGYSIAAGATSDSVGNGNEPITTSVVWTAGIPDLEIDRIEMYDLGLPWSRARIYPKLNNGLTFASGSSVADLSISPNTPVDFWSLGAEFFRVHVGGTSPAGDIPFTILPTISDPVAGNSVDGLFVHEVLQTASVTNPADMDLIGLQTTVTVGGVTTVYDGLDPAVWSPRNSGVITDGGTGVSNVTATGNVSGALLSLGVLNAGDTVLITGISKRNTPETYGNINPTGTVSGGLSDFNDSPREIAGPLNIEQPFSKLITMLATSDTSSGFVDILVTPAQTVVDMYFPQFGAAIAPPDTTAITFTDNLPAAITGTHTVTLTLSEPPANPMVVGDLIADAGSTIGNFIWTAPATATFDLTGSGASAGYSIAANSVPDAAGNNNLLHTGSATWSSGGGGGTATVTIDTPTAVQNKNIYATIKFSSDVTGFTMSDVGVTGGTATRLTAVSASEYQFKAVASGYGTVGLSIAANVVNENNLPTSESIVYTANTFYGGLVTWENDEPRGKLCSNLEFLRSWTPQCFTDLMRQSRTANNEQHAANPNVTYDADGYPTMIPAGETVSYLLNTETRNHFAGQHHVIWDGDGTIVYGNGLVKVGSMGANHDLVTFDGVTINSFIRITATNPADPIKNIRCYMAGGITDKDPITWHETPASVPAGETYLEFWQNPEIIFNPMELKSKMKYSGIRMMNWLNLNQGVRLSTLAQYQQSEAGTASTYTPPSVNTAPPALHDMGFNPPVKAMAEFCQILNAHPYYNSSHLMTDDALDFVGQKWEEHLPHYLKFRCAWVNEAWNGGFTQHWFMRGLAVNDPSIVDFSSYVAAGSPAFNSVAYSNATAAHASNSITRLTAPFSATPERVYKIVDGQAANSGLGNAMLTSPNMTVTLDAYSVAFYISDSAITAPFPLTDDKDDIIDKVALELDPANNGIALFFNNNKAVADALGLDLVTYEGGQHLVKEQMEAGYPTYTDGYPTVMREAVLDPRMKTDIYDPLLALIASQTEFFTHYKDIGSNGSFGYFNAMTEFPEQGGVVHPRMQALNAFAAAQ